MPEEPLSILDPRRFTPTLHANLVSEILALRRDQEDKSKIIESLEETLHTTREEHETLQTNLSNITKESRSLKRQLALLEGGTSSALGELARERDEAVEVLGETKKRLEAAQKKAKTQEEDSERVHDLWAKEKDDWEDERRKYERKIHVAESRLKTVLDEVAAFQAAQAASPHDGAESEDGEAGKDNDGASVRTASMTNSVRYSTMFGAGMGKANGHSLADELNFDDESDSGTDAEGRQSAFSIRHSRNFSRESVLSRTHARNVSLDSQFRPGSVARGRTYMNASVMERLEGGIREDDETEQETVKVEYTDSAVQYSPPPSPKAIPSKPSTPEPASEPVVRGEKTEMESPHRGEMEIEANQRRKRVQLSKPLAIEPPAAPSLMVSAASQTMDEPLSPPRTPISPTHLPPPPIVEEEKPSPPLPEMKSIATQTDLPPARASTPPAPVSIQTPVPIPSISVIPPTSRSATPQEHRLPQHSKDFGCQVSIMQSVDTSSASTQTSEIRIDKRLDKLPPHLHPSAISSRPVSPNPAANTAAAEDSKNFTPGPRNLPPRNPRRLTAKSSFHEDISSSPPASPISRLMDTMETHDAYPGNNDDGPLSNEKAPMRRPHRISSLFAGFEPETSEEGEGFEEADASDAEFQTALSAPKPKDESGKRSSVRSSPEQVRMVNKQAASVAKQIGGPEVYTSFSLVEGKVATKGSARAGEKSAANGGPRASGIRKAALIQSGIASHQTRSPSPGAQEHQDPPFPIPTRASSRRPPLSASVPSDTQHSPTRGPGGPLHRRGLRTSGAYRSSSIRKVRSAAAIPQNPRRRRRSSRSPPPPPMSPSEEAPDSPDLPPLPSNPITTPRGRDYGGRRGYQSHRSQPSTNTAYTENTNMGSQGSSQQQSGVVEAIAQTMVGEWMFKYVRRRKSFGVSDGGGRGEENSNDRHKRWVWLAPYERAILWSSKQPQSGSALMGKSGRKRTLPNPLHAIRSSGKKADAPVVTIQSVLDVKDDNPPPKGAGGQVFNRSILILTPQRALKFTATTAERHYLWLTALSFLAHSQQAVPEIMPSAAEPVGQKLTPDFDAAGPPRGPSRRVGGGIRDSIRLTKGRNPGLITSPRSQPHSPPPLPQQQQQQQQPEQTINASQLDDALATFKPDGFAPMPIHYRDLSRDAAEPPFIPRFHERAHEQRGGAAATPAVHGRKRSNTGGHVPPPLSFRGFSSPTATTTTGSYGHAPSNSTAGNSVVTTGTGSSDMYYQSQAPSSASGGYGNYMAPSTTAGSVRTSEASSRPGFMMTGGHAQQNNNGNGNGNGNNFFEAIGTVRMEAFISPLTFPRFDEHPDESEEWRYRARRRSKDRRRKRSRSHHRRDSYASRGTRATTTTNATGTTDYSGYGPSGGGGPGSERTGRHSAVDEDFFRDDPFKGF